MTNFNNGNKNDIKNCNNNRKVNDKIDNDKCIVVMTKNINRVKFKIQMATRDKKENIGENVTKI